MNWSRILNVGAGIAAFVVAVGPTLIPIVPPPVGAAIGVAIALGANWSKIAGTFKPPAP